MGDIIGYEQLSVLCRNNCVELTKL